MTAPVFAFDSWPTNGHLIAVVAKLYIPADALVVDYTYGRGTWWTIIRPAHFVAHDLRLDGVDFRHPPEADESVGAAAFDPPYKLNGRPDPAVDGRYGVDEPTRWQDRIALMLDGVKGIAPTIRPGGVLLAKCQDQVCSGHVRWQSDLITEAAAGCGLVKVDRFDFPDYRPQPEGRRQVHARRNTSQLLVFRKPPEVPGNGHRHGRQ